MSSRSWSLFHSSASRQAWPCPGPAPTSLPQGTAQDEGRVLVWRWDERLSSGEWEIEDFPVPVAAQTCATLGSNSRGTSPSMSQPLATTWQFGSVPGQGLEEWYVARVVYDYEASSPILYAMMRKRTYSANGLLVSVSAETAVEVDTPLPLAT